MSFKATVVRKASGPTQDGELPEDPRPGSLSRAQQMERDRLEKERADSKHEEIMTLLSQAQETARVLAQDGIPSEFHSIDDFEELAEPEVPDAMHGHAIEEGDEAAHVETPEVKVHIPEEAEKAVPIEKKIEELIGRIPDQQAVTHARRSTKAVSHGSEEAFMVPKAKQLAVSSASSSSSAKKVQGGYGVQEVMELNAPFSDELEEVEAAAPPVKRQACQGETQEEEDDAGGCWHECYLGPVR